MEGAVTEATTIGLPDGYRSAAVGTFGLIEDHQAYAHLMVGDRAGFDDTRNRLDQLAQDTYRPDHSAAARNLAIVGLLLDGDFDAIPDVMAEQRTANGQSTANAGVQAAQHLWLGFEQGIIDDAVPLLEALAEQAPDFAVYRGGLALFLAHAGEHDRARATLVDLVRAGRSFNMDDTYTMAIASAAEAAAIVGDGPAAERLIELLSPFTGQMVVVGMVAVCIGAVDRYLATLKTSLGDYDAAEAHYEAALTLEEGMRSPPLLARTQHWYARMLVRRAATGDADRARTLLGASIDTATAFGQLELARDGQALLTQLAGGPPTSP